MQALLARVSLPAIRSNALQWKRRAETSLIAVVKDDAYGHGAEEVALSLHHVASSFAVATAEEGAALRLAGITEDILVLTPPLNVQESVRLVLYGLTASVSSMPALHLIAEAGELTGKTPRAHIAVNTGMNRYGLRPERAGAAAREAIRAGIRVEGVFSHYFEPSDAEFRAGQEMRFLKAAEAVKEAAPAAVMHISATGGVFFGGKISDAVRVGLGLYGYAPKECKLPLRRAMKLYATVAHRCTQLGDGAGYAAAERKGERLTTLRFGYGDGFFREGFEGAVGKLCMDAAVFSGDLPFGRKVLLVSDFERYALEHGTSVYEALVRLPSKAVKEYIR